MPKRIVVKRFANKEKIEIEIGGIVLENIEPFKIEIMGYNVFLKPYVPGDQVIVIDED